MISSILKEATLLNDQTPTLVGVSNVIQLTEDSDILLVYARDKAQLDDLIKRMLPETFKGLLIAPFKPSREVNFLVKEKVEMHSLEKGLIEHFYPMPSPAPKLIGVTGTNGKTSVAWTIAELARITKRRGLYAGTPGVFINGQKKSQQVTTTTPSYLDLRKLLFSYGSEVDVCAIEVSSHALAQDRLKGVSLDAAGWTNFTQDHLDYHKTMEDYFESKKRIVNTVKSGKIYFPPDEHELKGKSSFSRGTLADGLENFGAKNCPSVFLRGFPKTNLELALALFNECFTLGETLDLSTLKLPPGRFQKIEENGRIFIIDYAHTPDALESVLKQVKETFSDKKVLTVFGCGGNRDKRKRPLMAQAAEALSDFLVVTSDNPRDEEPSQIIEDVIVGIKSKPFVKEVDRRKAIELAYEKTDSSWVVLVAGKGHEDYQEVGGVRLPFDDTKVVEEILG